MGNCFLISKFNIDQLDELNKYKNSKGFYCLTYKVTDLISLSNNKDSEIYYLVHVTFSKYEYINTFIEEVNLYNNKTYNTRISLPKTNVNFYEKTRHFSGFYIDLSHDITYPTVNFVKKINDPLLTIVYNKLLFKN